MVVRVAGLDVGERRIGVAVSDPMGVTAQPLGVVARQGFEQDSASLEQMLAGYEPCALVVGVPLAMNGTSGPAAERAKRLGKRFAARLGLPVVFVDERFSTAEAERVLISADVPRAARRKVVDATAAALILQTFLERGRGGLPRG